MHNLYQRSINNSIGVAQTVYEATAHYILLLTNYLKNGSP